MPQPPRTLQSHDSGPPPFPSASEHIRLLDQLTAPEKTQVLLRSTLFSAIIHKVPVTLNTLSARSQRGRTSQRQMSQAHPAGSSSVRPRSSPDVSPDSIRAGKRRAVEQTPTIMDHTNEANDVGPNDFHVPTTPLAVRLANPALPYMPGASASSVTHGPMDNSLGFLTPVINPSTTLNASSVVGYPLPPHLLFNQPSAYGLTLQAPANSSGPSADSSQPQFALNQLLSTLNSQELYDQVMRQSPLLPHLAPPGYYMMSPLTPMNQQGVVAREGAVNQHGVADQQDPDDQHVAIDQSPLAHRSRPAAGEALPQISNLDDPSMTGATSATASTEYNSLPDMVFTQAASLATSSTAESCIRAPVEGPVGAPYYRPLRELIQRLRAGRKPGDRWKNYEKNQIIQFWAGPEASDGHFAVGMAAKTAPRSDEALPYQWTILHVNVFFESREKITLCQTWSWLIKHHELLVQLGIKGSNLPVDTPPEVLIPRIKIQISPHALSYRLMDRLPVSDIWMWLYDDDQSWFARYHRKWIQHLRLYGTPNQPGLLRATPARSRGTRSFHSDGSIPQHGFSVFATSSFPPSDSTPTHESSWVDDADGAFANDADGAFANDADGAFANDADGAFANNADGAFANSDVGGAFANVPLVTSAPQPIDPVSGQPLMLETMRDHHAVCNREISLDEAKEQSVRAYTLFTRLNCVQQMVNIQHARDKHLADGIHAILQNPAISEETRRVAEERLREIYLTSGILVDYEKVIDNFVAMKDSNGLLARLA
ncbi:hypothetical protein FRC12_016567 [Ceratobasidium sp. 428]|nr:hypothetical protein FRC12_016567 [Ceratobasidium sp. 428]